MNKLISRVLSVGLSTVAMSAILTSCTENELVETKTVAPKENGMVTIMASAGDKTRVSYDWSDYTKLTWATGDKIQVYGDDMAGEIYTIVTEPGAWQLSDSEPFTGNPVDGATKAFYPVTRLNDDYTETQIASTSGYNHQTISLAGQSQGSWSNSLTYYTYMAGDVEGTADAPTVAFKHLTSQLELKMTMPAGYDSYEEPVKRIELVATDGTQAIHEVLHLTDDSKSTMTDSLSIEISGLSFGWGEVKTAEVYMKVAPESFTDVPMELRMYTESSDGLDTPRYYRANLGKQSWELIAGRQYTIEATMVADEVVTETSSYPESSYELSEDGLTLIKWLGKEPVVDLTQDPILTQVTAIEGHAFKELEKLEQVIMDDDIVSMGNSVFAYCKNLKTVILPNTLKTTGIFTFYKCESLTSINLPESITLIDSGAFNGCESLEELPAMTNVDSISSSAFQDCKALTKIQIQSWTSKVKGIAAMAFMGCDNVTYVNLNSLEIPEVSNSMFNGCSKLKVVLLPSTVTRIGNGAFMRCRELTSFTIPANTVQIGSTAFVDTSIESVYVPAATEEIGELAMISVKSIEVDPANAMYCSVDEGGFHGLFTKDKSTLIRQYVDGGSYVVPSTVATIKADAFAISSNCMTLTIPSSVSTFESNVFGYMTGLTTINYNKASATGLISEEGQLMSTDKYANVTLYVPSTAVASFKETAPWNQFNVKGKNF